MTLSSERYVMLMASLPHINLLSEKEPPINRTRLLERLKMLEPEDREELDRITSILSWSYIDTGNDDAAFVARAEKIISAVRSSVLKTVARDRLEIRTLMSALRRRYAGEEASAIGPSWGYGRYVDQIRKNWNLPDFGLGRSFPWLPAAKEKLESGDSAGLERILLDASWNAGASQEAGHEFDLEAVALYLIRWSIAERWSRYDADVATARFAELLTAAFPQTPAPTVAP
jgi:hypothetical protein